MKRFIVAVLAAFSFVYAMGLGNRSAQNMKKLMNAEFAISEFYVDSVNGEKLVEDAIRGKFRESLEDSRIQKTYKTKVGVMIGVIALALYLFLNYV